MKEEIVGYGVFESAEEREIFVGYYLDDKLNYDIEEDNFYEKELEATQVALQVANDTIKQLLNENKGS